MQTNFSLLICAGCAVVGWTGVTAVFLRIHWHYAYHSRIPHTPWLTGGYLWSYLAMINVPVQTTVLVGAGKSRSMGAVSRRAWLQGSPGCLAALNSVLPHLAVTQEKSLPCPWHSKAKARCFSSRAKTSLLRDLWIINFCIIIYNIEHQGRWQTIILPFPSSERDFHPRSDFSCAQQTSKAHI